MRPLSVEGGDVVLGTHRRLFGGVKDFWLKGRLVWPSGEAIGEGSSAPHTAHCGMADGELIHIYLDMYLEGSRGCRKEEFKR